MTLSDVFAQITIEPDEAIVMLSAWIANLRDSQPDLFTRMLADIHNLSAPEVNPPA